MSDVAAAPARQPFLILPGFMPDAIPFAARSALALMLAYWIAFTCQVDSASSAGVCVAIVAQPSAGMAKSKAFWRLLGTGIGGVVALALLSAFPQNRTMLLAGFALWLGFCTFLANLLRDFRTYGAALSGYTVAIIAVGIIDTPDQAIEATLNRVAAIVIGVISVMVVNNIFGSTTAYDALVQELRDRTGNMTKLVLDALEGRTLQGDLPMVRIAAGAAALQTQGTYAAYEFPDGLRRRNGALHTISAILAMVSASRAVAALLGPATPDEVRAHLRAVADAIRTPEMPAPVAPAPHTPNDALLLERADQLLVMQKDALAGLRVLTEPRGDLPRIKLRPSYDLPGALLGAVRAMIGVGLGAVFLILAGWPGATLPLIQFAAVLALLGTTPNPSAASVAFALPLLPVALVVGVVNFLVLPGSSGFISLCLAVMPVAFFAALTVRQEQLAKYSGATFLYVPLLLSPANTETYDLGGYCDTVLELALAMTFTYLAFGLILKVSPHRRLYRVAAQVAADLRRTIHDRHRQFERGRDQSVLYDRMSRAITWLGPATNSREKMLGHIYGMGELDLAYRRARSGLATAQRAEPALRQAIEAAHAAMDHPDPDALQAAGQALLDYPANGAATSGIRLAVSGMAGIARIFRSDAPSMRFYRRITQ